MERQDTLLITSTSADARAQLRSVLMARYNLLETADFRQAIQLLGQNRECIAAMVVDVDAMGSEGFEVFRKKQFTGLLEQIPVIVVCRSREDSQHALFFRYGAADVIPLDYDSYAMLHRIETIAELHKHKHHLEAVVQEQSDILHQSSSTIVDVLSTIIEYRSIETGNHILRIRSLTQVLMEQVMKQCPEYGLSARQVALIASASVLHDIGKISIPDAILNKPGPLNREQWAIMKTHSFTGSQILTSLGQAVEEEYLRFAHNICHYHHERWDGSGYPEGLVGDAIPICAQVVGLADAYDALTSKRVYKDAYPFSSAVNMILSGECGAFSPKLLECFKHVTAEFEALGRQYADGEIASNADLDMSLPLPNPLKTNSLERIRAKYFALVHYVDAFLVEIELDQELFHIVYNPYPELIQLNRIHTLAQLRFFVLDRIVVPAQRAKMRKLLFEDIPEFVNEDLRRSTYQFQYQNASGEPGGTFEMTLLRIAADSGRRSLAVLCRKLPSPTSPVETPIPQTGCILRNDNSLSLIQMGRTSLGLSGFSPETLSAQMDGCLMNLIHPDDRRRVRNAFREQLLVGHTVEVEHRLLIDGEAVAWVVNKCRLLHAPDGQEYLYCILTDISMVMRQQKAIRDQLNRYKVILAQSENVLFEWDIDRNFIDFSSNWRDIFGYDAPTGAPADLLRDSIHIHPDDISILLKHIRKLQSGLDYEVAETRMLNARGSYLWYRFRATALRDHSGKLNRVVGIVINIDQDKQARQLLEDRSERDSLTKLLNNATCRSQGEQYLAQSPEGTPCALLIIDLDNFKQINDQYGHLFGDAVLCKVSRELERLFRSQDIVGRIGGDEFLVLMRGISDMELLRHRCTQILDAFQNAFQQPKLSGSVGVALCPIHGTTYQELFSHADKALYHAKALGKNSYCFYGSFDGPPLEATAVSQRIDSDIDLGLAQDKLVRHVFQRLYTASDVKDAINRSINLLGRAMNVSRVYIFENTPDGLHCDNTFEWCNTGITPEIHNLQHVSYITDIPGYQNNFNAEGIFHCPDIHKLPQRAREILEPQNIKSMLQCAIIQEGRFLGYVGFDECVFQRYWTQEEIQTLTYLSNVLSTFLLKYREQERSQHQARELQSILDNQNSWLYIIDPDTQELKYINSALRRDIPTANPGAPCYQALFGRSAICPGCPVRNIRTEKAVRCLLTDSKFSAKLLTEASLIQWQNQDACLVTSRKLPEE